jgi:hypothetical protein
MLQAGHAIIGALLPEYDPVQKISIVPRGATGGATFFAPNEEQLESGLYSRTYLENRMAVSLGGRVAEELILGPDDVTTGAANDFQQVRGKKAPSRPSSAFQFRVKGLFKGKVKGKRGPFKRVVRALHETRSGESLACIPARTWKTAWRCPWADASPRNGSWGLMT